MPHWLTAFWEFCQNHWPELLVGLIALLVGVFLGWLLAAGGVDTTFVLAMTKACIWPVVVVVGLLLLHNKVKEVSFDWGDKWRLRVLLNEQMNEVEKVFPPAPLKEIDPQIRELAGKAPYVAIQEAWAEVTSAAEGLLGKRDIPFKVLGLRLRQQGLIEPTYQAILSQLRSIQRRARRRPDAVTAIEALRFSALAAQMRRYLEAQTAARTSSPSNPEPSP